MWLIPSNNLVVQGKKIRKKTEDTHSLIGVPKVKARMLSVFVPIIQLENYDEAIWDLSIWGRRRAERNGYETFGISGGRKC